MVARKLGHSVFVDGGNVRAVGSIKILALRGGGIGIGVVESGRVGCKYHGVRPCVFGELREAGSVKRYSVEMSLERWFFRGRKIDQALCFVDGIYRSTFPFALSALRKLP